MVDRKLTEFTCALSSIDFTYEFFLVLSPHQSNRSRLFRYKWGGRLDLADSCPGMSVLFCCCQE